MIDEVNHLRERLQEKNALLMAYAEHGTPEEVAYVYEWRARLSRVALSVPHAYVYADDPDDESGRCQLCDVEAATHMRD